MDESSQQHHHRQRQRQPYRFVRIWIRPSYRFYCKECRRWSNKDPTIRFNFLPNTFCRTIQRKPHKNKYVPSKRIARETGSSNEYDEATTANTGFCVCINIDPQKWGARTNARPLSPIPRVCVLWQEKKIGMLFEEPSSSVSPVSMILCLFHHGVESMLRVYRNTMFA